MKAQFFSSCVAFFVGMPGWLFSAEAADTLKLVHTIPLTGVKGRFDHFAIDTNTHHLFVAALGNDTLEILDVAAGKRLHTIQGLRKPTGVVFLAAENQFGVANGNDGTFRVYDGKTYQQTARVEGLDDADNVRRDSRTGLIYVGYGDGGLAVVDPRTWKVASKIKLAAHPESFQLERDGKRIFINLPDAKKVGVVDREAGKLVAEWPMEKFHANFPMALDEPNRRLFIGCRQPARLAILDSSNGHIVSDLGISGDTDDLFYDAKLKRIYVSCGEGFIDVIEQQSPDTYARLERIPTSKGARTSFFSPELREFYLAVPEQAGKSAELRIYKTADDHSTRCCCVGPRKAFQPQVLESVSAGDKEIMFGQPASAVARRVRREHSPWTGEGGVAQARGKDRFDSRGCRPYGHVVHARLDPDPNDERLFQGAVGRSGPRWFAPWRSSANGCRTSGAPRV